MQKENKKIIRLIKNSSKYLIFGVFAFIIFFSSASITFGQQAQDPTVTVTGTPNPVNYGDPATVSWTSTDATSCTASGGGTGTTGSFTVNPTSGGLNYLVTCTGLGGSVTAGTHFTILFKEIKAPAVTVTATPTSVVSGGTSVIHWSTTDPADYCSLINGKDHNALSGSFTTIPLSSTTTFYVTCTKLYPDTLATGLGSATVSVQYVSFVSDVLTKEASEITDTGATVKGTLNPGGNDTSGYFRYSTVSPGSIAPVFCNDIYGSQMQATNEVPLGSGNDSVDFTTTLGGLEPNTTYYYCAIGSNNGEIRYGGVRSFTTDVAGSQNNNGDNGQDSLSVTTENALVVDAKSAYLNGTFNSSVPSITWFEYRKADSTDKWSTQINQTKHIAGMRGNLNFLLKGLTGSTTYQFRAGIRKDTTGNASGSGGIISFVKNIFSNFFGTSDALAAATTGGAQFDGIIYGSVLTFQTGATNNTGGGNGNDGTGYVNPCDSTTDTDCNGTGGGNGNGTGTGVLLPDLIAGPVSPTTIVVNTPTDLSVTIRNQGTGSTVVPVPPKNIPPKAVPMPTGGAVSVFDSFWKANTALAAATATGGAVVNNNSTTSTAGSFYNFFQVSTVGPSVINNGRTSLPPVGTGTGTGVNSTGGSSTSGSGTGKTGTGVNSANGNKNGGSSPGTGGSVSILNNLFGTKEALAAATATTNTTAAGGAPADSTIINFPPALMSALGPMASKDFTQSFTFPSLGTYYARACADKKSPTDTGQIRESYENNNCGPWTILHVVSSLQVCNDVNATNYGGALPCIDTIGPPVELCQDTKALNYGSPVPCVYGSGFCVDPSATNYGNALPCTYNGAGNGWGSGFGSGNGNGNGTGNNNGNGNGNNNNGNVATNPSNLALGDTATPPDLALVHYHEGIETVFQRQIVANPDLASSYGYQAGADIQSFAWTLADILAKSFGYVNANREEIRVGPPDMAAYQLYMTNGVLTVYEYYNNKIVNIEKMTDTIRNKYGYEYYFKK